MEDKKQPDKAPNIDSKEKSPSLRILIAAPVHQDEATLKLYLESLYNLDTEGLSVSFFFIDDNSDSGSKAALQYFARKVQNVQIADMQNKELRGNTEITHQWEGMRVKKLASFRNKLLKKTVSGGFDALLAVDSDLLLQPGTLRRLLSTGKDIVSDIFWTRWMPNQEELPNVWLSDKYDFVKQSWETPTFSPEEWQKQSRTFLNMLRVPGLYQVGGLGACTLISRRAIQAGLSYTQLPNVSFWGEDRHFCIRAAALGFGLFVDTVMPAFHVYRPAYCKRGAAFLEENCRRRLNWPQDTYKPLECRSAKILLIPPTCDMVLNNPVYSFKDIFMVPCVLQEKFGYSATIAAYGIDYAVLHRYHPQCHFVEIPNSGIPEADALAFLREHAVEYDVLYLFGPYPDCAHYALTYKQYNPAGKIYLKMDANRWWLSRLMKQPYFYKLLQLCDVASVESLNLHFLINKLLPFDIDWIPNGYYDFFTPKPLAYEEKENILLTVGRLGTPDKQTGMLLKAFLAADLPGWKLRLVGDIDPAFKQELDGFRRHPNFRKVELVGRISDRERLDGEFRRAKVFCMTSKKEGAAHVYADAAKNGCYIVSTDVDSAENFSYGEKCETITPVGNTAAYISALKSICADEEKRREAFRILRENAQWDYNWVNICGKIDLLLRQKGVTP